MSDGFIRKKVESLTLGEKLVKLRSQYRMSLLEISKATRIQVKYLEALESGDHSELPAEVYVRGFLRSYARYLGLEDDAFIKLYDKEKHIRAHLGKTDVTVKDETRKPLVMSTWVVTPRAVIFTVIACILLGTFWYLFRELRSFVAEPLLVVLTPIDGAMVSETALFVNGRTDPGARVRLNEGPVFVDERGEFRESVTLQPGPNKLTVTATNRFEKTKTISLTVENTFTPPAVVPDPLTLWVSSSEALAALKLEIDGVVVWNGPWEAEKSERFSVRENLSITTSSPKDTRLQVGEGESFLPDPTGATEASFQYDRALLKERSLSPNTNPLSP